MNRLTLNHSMRSQFEECESKFLLGTICGLRTLTPESAGLDFGAAFHIASEDFDKWDSLDRSVDVFSQNFLLEDSFRTVGRARELLVDYRKTVDQTGLRFHFYEEGVEKPFSHELTSWLTHVGKLDRELDGDSGFAEIKTTKYLYTSAGNPMPYVSQWIGHNSLLGYAFPKKFRVCYLIALGVYPQKDGKNIRPACVIFPIEIHEWELEHWLQSTLRIGERILNVFNENNFDQNTEGENLERMLKDKLWIKFNKSTNRCNPWPYTSPCRFRDLCTRNMHEGLLRSQYVVEPYKYWDMNGETE